MSETPAAIYCRISKDAEDDGLGVARQERLCRTICRQHGWTVSEVFTDNDVSAAGRKPRPSFERLLQEVEEGRFRVIVALDLDRLERSHKDLLRIVEACTKHGVRVAFEREAGFDPVTGDGMLEIEIRTTVAAEEIRKVRKRVTRQKRERAEKGLHQGGPRPYGYASSARTEVVEVEAGVIREAADRFLRGASQGDVARWLNEGRVPTAQDRVDGWTVSRLRKLLMRADLAGLREVRDETGEVVKTVETAWPTILTVEHHEQLRARLTRVRRHRAPSAYLLTPPEPLAFCGTCEAPLYGAGSRERRNYRCRPESNAASTSRGGCGTVRIRADWLEDHVVDFALWWGCQSEVIRSRREERQKVEGEARELRAALDDLDLRESRLVDDLVDLGLSRAKVRAKAAELRQEREHLERRLGRVQTAEQSLTEAGSREEAGRRWDELTVGERRAALRSLLGRVQVMPGVRGRNTFDPDRIKIAGDWGVLIEVAERYAREHGLPGPFDNG